MRTVSTACASALVAAIITKNRGTRLLPATKATAKELLNV
jgi:UTP-glucose-1-phosphate uridylyltransferase